jgi:hypothetical protein
MPELTIQECKRLMSKARVQIRERDELIRDMMELDQMRHGPFSWERQEKMQDLRGSVNARLIKMGFVQEVEG